MYPNEPATSTTSANVPGLGPATKVNPKVPQKVPKTLVKHVTTPPKK
jgi:hypothetical protein